MAHLGPVGVKRGWRKDVVQIFHVGMIDNYGYLVVNVISADIING